MPPSCHVSPCPAIVAASTPYSGPAALAAVPSVLRVTALANDAHELVVYGEIGESFWTESVTAKQVIDELKGVRSSLINVRINSQGGSVVDGLAIYNALREHPAAIRVQIDGEAASIASLIAMAGDEVIAPTTSLMMLHGPSSPIYGNAVQLRERADALDKYADAMVGAYVRKTGRSQSEIEAILKDGKDHFFTGAEAVAFGLADSNGETEAIDDPAATASGLRSLFATFGIAPNYARNCIRSAIAATAFPTFARLGREIQTAVLAAIPEGQMKDTMQHIYANGGGAPATPAVVPAPNPPPAPVAAAPAAPVAVSPQARAHAIGSIFAAHRGNPELAELERQFLADPAVTAEIASQRLLARLGAGNEPLNQPNPTAAVGTLPTFTASVDERDKRIELAVNGIFARAGLAGADDARFRHGNPFATMSLLQVAEQELIRRGVRVVGMDRMQIAREALRPSASGGHSTSDFPILLQNALNKSLQRGYTLKPFTWRLWCATGSLSDLRPHIRYQTGSFSSLAERKESGEYKDGKLTDGEKETVTGKMMGRILRITPEIIINDDLGVFSNLATKLGTAAARTIEADVFTLLTSNPTMNDGYALFSAEHANLAGSGSAPSVTSFSTCRQAMGAQKEPGANDFLDITPDVFLSSMAVRDSAVVVNQSQYDPDTANKLQRVNTSAGMFRQIIDTPRLSGNGWYAFADKDTEAVIEVAFLDGNQNPQITQQEDFNTGGLAWRVDHTYSVGAVGWRGGYRNPGP